MAMLAVTQMGYKKKRGRKGVNGQQVNSFCCAGWIILAWYSWGYTVIFTLLLAARLT